MLSSVVFLRLIERPEEADVTSKQEDEDEDRDDDDDDDLVRMDFQLVCCFIICWKQPLLTLSLSIDWNMIRIQMGLCFISKLNCIAFWDNSIL